ncbi:catechol 2,3-dioxygenase-like lactoylglutathione lyase family enzyme [Rhizobium subbaraonis]|uniref:Catechol 2,3-dioxygenase-like lactoylglutathione lyase family enzyme n=1 Tax=Rhizobium subbaraonis TaxID=908946 RepID=A0A285UQI9_9HYPH|nr:VOC family protein [Rhizobium subbaraonis]SOC44185.1 catechol 2,3-dioxygenase-like lactoylglutathione lyase family enzyme [Rhizobium subbaraonis]
MTRRIALVTLVVPDYDRAIAFYCGALRFDLVEDTQLPDGKRWVVVRPNGGEGPGLLLAQASGERQQAAIGNQAGGRVGFFLHTDDFERDFASFVAAGVRFLEQPRTEAYGKVAVFEDVFGNTWDLLQPAG